MPRKVNLLTGFLDEAQAALSPEGRRDVEVSIDPRDAPPWGADAVLKVVGTDVPRVDGLAKATGTARYAMDRYPERVAWAGFVTSPHAHAKVLSVDASAAEVMPGVLAIQTFEGTRVTYAGQYVAAVCAETPETRDDALRAIVVDYEVLPHVVTTEAGRQPGAPRVDPARDPVSWDRGAGEANPDAEAALAASAVRVRGTWRTQTQTHSCLEPHGAVWAHDDDGGAVVWASTQSTGSYRGLASAVGVPPGRLRVLTPHMGGGFGSKLQPHPFDAVAASFAKQLRRPVHCLMTRRLEHQTGGCRPDSIQEMALGGRADGTFEAIVGRTFGTAGNASGGAGCANTRVYRFPHVSMPQATVATFTGRGLPFRAPGHPQGLFALEGLVDLFCHEAKLDPLAVRLKNDPHPVRQAQWRIGAERIDWAKLRRTTPGSDPGPVKRGLGCAAAIWYQKGRGDWNVDLLVERDGTVVVMNAAQDIGTGTKTVLALLVAEEMGIDPDQVQVRIGDTNFPPGPGSGGSTTAPSLGPAAREAALRARESLAALLARAWKTDVSQVRFEGGEYVGPEGQRGSFADAVSRIGDAGLRVRGTRRPNYEGFHAETAGCQFAQVAVDTETGVVRVEKVVAVHDAGRIVDTLTARSQVNGGVIQGVSYALFEERRLDENLGNLVNGGLDTYRICGMEDVPEIDIVLTSLASGFNNAGMMGLGEPVTVPTAGAIANAVFNATGVQVRELPLTPARVLHALGRV